MTQYTATYKDPVDGRISYLWTFSAFNDHHAIATAQRTILERKDGLVDVLFHIERNSLR